MQEKNINKYILENINDMIDNEKIEPMFYNFDFENISQNMIYLVNTQNTKKIMDMDYLQMYYLVDYDTKMITYTNSQNIIYQIKIEDIIEGY